MEKMFIEIKKHMKKYNFNCINEQLNVLEYLIECCEIYDYWDGFKMIANDEKIILNLMNGKRVFKKFTLFKNMINWEFDEMLNIIETGANY